MSLGVDVMMKLGSDYVVQLVAHWLHSRKARLSIEAPGFSPSFPLVFIERAERAVLGFFRAAVGPENLPVERQATAKLNREVGRSAPSASASYDN